MPLSVQCPSCHHHFAVPDKMVGRGVKCPKCERPFTAVVPTPAVVPAVASYPAPPAPLPPAAPLLPPVAACLTPPGEIVALAKPQFEVGRGRVGRGGIVRDPAQHRAVLADLAAWSAGAGLPLRALCASPIRGAEGNAEFFLHLAPGGPALSGEALEAAVRIALEASAGDA